MLDPDAQIAEIKNELSAAGVPSDTVAQKRSAQQFRLATTVLMRWLPRATGNAKLAVLAALKHPAAAQVEGVAPELIREFMREGSDVYRWSIADALAYAGNESVFDDIAGLLADRSFGTDRQMLTDAIARIDPPRSQAILIDCLDDETINGHALKALRKLGAPVPTSAVNALCDDDRAWVRREAKRVLEMNS
jgi:hypothetical protein